MKRIFLCLLLSLSCLFSVDLAAEHYLRDKGVNVVGARKGLISCYSRNSVALRSLFTYNMSTAVRKAKAEGLHELKRPHYEHIMGIEQTFNVVAEYCMETDEEMTFAIQVFTLMGDMNENNPSMEDINNALNLTKFIQSTFYEVSENLNGKFKTR